MCASKSIQAVEDEEAGDGIYRERQSQNRPWEVRPDLLPVERVAVDLLVSSDSPRLVGESVDHIRMLAESGTDLPPILVHRPTMRVIDGMHRLRATTLRGERELRAVPRRA